MLNIKRIAGDMGRFKQILDAFAVGGFAFFIKRLKLSHCLSPICRIKCFFNKSSQCPEEDLPAKFRLILESLGPTFIKIGQILSVRPDFIPAEYAAEFTKLQDHVPPFPFVQVKEIVEEELSRPLENVFRSFDQVPVAAASLAQVHKAVLKSGEVVAVKVQRPGVKKIIEQDMRIIFFLAGLVEQHVPEAKPFRPSAAAREFANYTLKELDFVIEGKNADRFRYNFRNNKGVKVPKIFWDCSSSKVLVMEFIEGVKMGNHDGMGRMGINHGVLAQNCTRACLEPVLSHGFFHADPHPGNVWVVKGNKVCYLDFGMVGIVTQDMKRKILLCFNSLLNKEVESALRHLLRLTEQSPSADYDAFKGEASDILLSLYIDSTKRETNAKAFYRIVASGAKHGVIFPSNMVLLAKSLMTGEAMCMMTHKDFDLIATTRPTIERIYREEFGPQRAMKSLQEYYPLLLEFLEKLPELSDALLKKIGERSG